MSQRKPLDLSRASALTGVVLAVIAALLCNGLAMRRFQRWDVTAQKRYSLSAPTLETLHTLPDAVHVWVLLAQTDPLGQSVRQLLVAYQAEAPKLDVVFVDPDRDPLRFEEAKRKFRIEAGRSEDGRVVTDAAVIVVSGDKHWFVTTQDLLAVSTDGDGRATPKEEQALTVAIRSVLGGTKAQLCFTTGHGELALDDGSDRGLGHLKTLLEKDNFVPRVVDDTAGKSAAPYKDCAVVLVAGPRGGFAADEANRLRTYALEGGNVLIGASPNTKSEAGQAFEGTGLEPVLAPFGIVMVQALVLEHDEAKVLGAAGVDFEAEARAHALTAGLVGKSENTMVPRTKVRAARPLRRLVEPGAPASFELLVTTDKALALTDLDVPEGRPAQRRDKDLSGPFAVAIAAERPKVSASAAHGPRMVVLGSTAFFAPYNWQEPLGTRGAAVLVDNAISWLSARPAIVDVPEKAQVPAGIRISEGSRKEIRMYVLVYMPAAALLLALAVLLRRRSTERVPHAPAPPRRPRKPKA
jgi:hypothetical protein